ncbi:MAG: preprotein translocase subunit YajC, partial [Gammaproteobacteria bacterium]
VSCSEEARHLAEGNDMGFIQDAYAQTGGGGAGGLLGSFLPLILIFVVFWFLLIRPQQKKAKEHKEMIGAVTKGDEVVTSGGLLGRVKKVGDDFVLVELAEGHDVNVQRFAIANLMPKGTIKSLSS